MLIASVNLIEHVADKPWPGWTVTLFGMKITMMSNGIAAMVLVALILLAVLIPLTRRWKAIPTGGRAALEAIVVFVRDMIARPALHDKAYTFLPYLVTLFVFVLGLNLLGIIPLEPVTKWLGGFIPVLEGRQIGGTATSVPMVCAGLAGVTLVTIVGCGFWQAARRKREKDKWPMAACVALSPILWFSSLSPPIPGAVGRILMVPLALLELVGAAAKCFALMVRLVANMFAGHMLLAVLMMLAMQVSAHALKTEIPLLGVSFLCVLASVGVTLIELLVAALQAYIFTFLTAMFLGLYVEPAH